MNSFYERILQEDAEARKFMIGKTIVNVERYESKDGVSKIIFDDDSYVYSTFVCPSGDARPYFTLRDDCIS